MPPPPDNFPDGWESEWQPSFENAQIAARPDVQSQASSEPPSKPAAETPPTPSPRSAPAPQPAPAAAATPAAQPTRQGLILPPSLYGPLAQAEQDQDHPPRQITVVLRPSGDAEMDRRRIKAVYGTLISFHGKDRFSFQIFEGGRGHLLDFPGDSTHI